jgi:hypothetical protein
MNEIRRIAIPRDGVAQSRFMRREEYVAVGTVSETEGDKTKSLVDETRTEATVRMSGILGFNGRSVGESDSVSIL